MSKIKTLPICRSPICNNTVKRKDKVYCSRKCSSFHLSEKAISNRQTHFCVVCDISYTVHPYREKTTKYCSKTCKKATDIRELKNRTENNHPRYIENKCRCYYCGTEFHRPESAVNGKTFCSNECYLSYSRVTIICKYCEKEREVQRNEADKVFCDKGCYGKWLSRNRTGNNHPNWKGGWEPYYGADWHRQRKRCRERDRFTCRICHVTSNEVGSENMDCHHYIPYRISKDNSLENLILLCDSCHHKVEYGKLVCPYP